LAEAIDQEEVAMDFDHCAVDFQGLTSNCRLLEKIRNLEGRYRPQREVVIL